MIPSRIIREWKGAQQAVASALAKQETKSHLMRDWMRHLRKRHNVSLRQLAKQLGFSAAYVSDVELGRRNLTQKFIDNYFAAIRAVTRKPIK